MKALISAATSAACSLLSAASAADPIQSLDPLTVTGSDATAIWGGNESIVGPESLRTVDTADFLRRLPGSAVVRNGSLTGIAQLRGLSGDRVGVMVDGMSITPACPNHMDPPLHYANPGEGDLVRLFAGMAPVSEGGNRLGGTISVGQIHPVFGNAENPTLGGRLNASYLGNQNAFMLGADLRVLSSNANFSYRGNWATADDLRIPGGTVSASGFDTNRHLITGAWRTAGGYVAVDAGLSNTHDAGTPALPMDMISDDSWHFGFAQSEAFSWGTVESRVYLHDIEHLMDNYSLRLSPLPGTGMAMNSPSSSRDWGWSSNLILPRDEDTFRTGFDFQRNEFNAYQVALATRKTRDTFNQYRKNQLGAYLDWERDWSDTWSTRIGLRGDVVSSDADPVSNGILPPPGPMRNMLLADQQRFNSSDRSKTDVLPSAMAAITYQPDDLTSLELAFGMTSRAPSMVERYLWTPLSASAGQADGRNYLGNLNLDPETGYQIGLGIERRGACWNAKLTPFYQIVHDYIQGVPIARMDMNKQAVLEYQNLDRVKLYGFEFEGGWQINEAFALDTVVSYVRGKNDKTGGSLYRIAPLRGLVDFSYRHEAWESHFEVLWAAEQNDVSLFQGETPSPGYGILNFRLARMFNHGIRWEAGVENILDKQYAEHLSGVNRVRASDVAVGERIPSAARFAYTSLSWEF